MDLDKAKEIYLNPNGHTEEELHECLRILNSQELTLTPMQFLAIKDAHDRLGIPIQNVLEN